MPHTILNTKDSGHDTASVMMMRGRKDEPAMKYPDIGAILAKELARADSAVPDYVSFTRRRREDPFQS